MNISGKARIKDVNGTVFTLLSPQRRLGSTAFLEEAYSVRNTILPDGRNCLDGNGRFQLSLE